MITLNRIVSFLRNRINADRITRLVLNLPRYFQGGPINLVLTLVAELLWHLPLSSRQRQVILILLLVVMLLIWWTSEAFAGCVPADGHTCTLGNVG